MQIDKIREAIKSAEHFSKRAAEILEEATRNHPGDARFLRDDGNHAKMIKKASNWLKTALEEMRRL
jgi:hypothetical protein